LIASAGRSSILDVGSPPVAEIRSTAIVMKC
jgi:hypothetical protein